MGMIRVCIDEQRMYTMLAYVGIVLPAVNLWHRQLAASHHTYPADAEYRPDQTDPCPCHHGRKSAFDRFPAWLQLAAQTVGPPFR